MSQATGAPHEQVSGAGVWVSRGVERVMDGRVFGGNEGERELVYVVNSLEHCTQ